MSNVQFIDLVESDDGMEENSVKYAGSVRESPVVHDWYSEDVLRVARKKLNAEKLKLAEKRAILDQYKRARRHLRVEQIKLQRKVSRLEKRKKLVWVKPPKSKKPVRARGRNAPVGHPGMALLVHQHRTGIRDLIKTTQSEVLHKLPKVQLLMKLTIGEIEHLIKDFLTFTVGKISKLRLINSAFYDFDKVTGGTVFHVERLIQELECVVNNVEDYVLAQLNPSSTPHVSLRDLRWCPAHWKDQHVLASLWTHLENERAKLERLHKSYIAVSREPPVIPPLHLSQPDTDDEGSQKI